MECLNLEKENQTLILHIRSQTFFIVRLKKFFLAIQTTYRCLKGLHRTNFSNHIYSHKGVFSLGRYEGKITHSYSKNPNRPTFTQTLEKAKIIYVNSILEKLTPHQQEEFVRLGKQEGLLV